jgi:hypothetical protein
MVLRRDLLAFALVGGTALLFLVTFPIFAVTRDPNISSYLLAGFAGIITFTLYLDRGFLQGGLRFWWVALTIAVEVGARLGFLLLLASALDAGLLGTMAALLVGALLANAVSARMIGRCAAPTTERTTDRLSTASTLLGYTGLMMAAYSLTSAMAGPPGGQQMFPATWPGSAPFWQARSSLRGAASPSALHLRQQRALATGGALLAPLVLTALVGRPAPLRRPRPFSSTDSSLLYRFGVEFVDHGSVHVHPLLSGV